MRLRNTALTAMLCVSALWTAAAAMAAESQASSPAAMAQYQRQHAALTWHDVDGRLRLAAWAQARGLERQTKTLFREILALQPDHADAYERLVELSGAYDVDDAPGHEQALLKYVDGPFERHETRHFTLIHGHDPDWAKEAGRLLEETHSRFYQAFGDAGYKPLPLKHRLLAVGFNQRGAFDRFARRADGLDMSWSGGYYSSRTNLVAFIHDDNDHDHGHAPGTSVASASGSISPTPRMSADGETWALAHVVDVAKITHEAAHQLAFNSGVQARGVAYPLWASEGLATNFESDDQGRFGLDQDNAVRRRHLVRAYQRGRLMPLEQLVGATRVPTDLQDANDLYAQTWGFFRFLFHHRSDELRTYLTAMAQQSPGRASEDRLRHQFIRAFGPISELEKPWRDYIQSLSRPAR